MRKLQKIFIVDDRTGSKHASGTAFTVEEFYIMSIFINVNFIRVIRKFAIDLLISRTNKKYVGLKKKV